MAVTQLSLYQGALTLLGERICATTSENREPVRVLNQIWTDGNGGAQQHCLEQAAWKWAIRTEMYTYSPSVEPSFGYQFAFNKPDDWVRTEAMCTDPYFNVPLTMYSDEAGYWFSDWQTIYIKYVSNDPSYGLNYTLWPMSFIKYFEAYLAFELAQRITQDEKKLDMIEKKMIKRLLEARSKDAHSDPAKFMPMGAWAGSRFGRYWKGGRGSGGAYG